MCVLSALTHRTETRESQHVLILKKQKKKETRHLHTDTGFEVVMKMLQLLPSDRKETVISWSVCGLFNASRI